MIDIARDYFFFLFAFSSKQSTRIEFQSRNKKYISLHSYRCQLVIPTRYWYRFVFQLKFQNIIFEGLWTHIPYNRNKICSISILNILEFYAAVNFLDLDGSKAFVFFVDTFSDVFNTFLTKNVEVLQYPAYFHWIIWQLAK